MSYEPYFYRDLVKILTFRSDFTVGNRECFVFLTLSLLLFYQQATSMADSVSVGSDVPENISIDTLNAELEEVHVSLTIIDSCETFNT